MRRVSTPESAPRRREHPWEQARRSAFARWEAELRRVPYGRPLPDVVGFASSIEPPADWGEAGSDRTLFALSALPTGSGSTFLSALPARTRRPAEGSLVRIARPLKRVLTIPESSAGEVLLDARAGVLPATWEETFPGVSAPSASAVVPTLAGLWRLPPSVVETLLLPIVGSTPWHGRPAGVGLHMEVESWSLTRLRMFLADVVSLAPEWVSNVRGTSSKTIELVSGARIRRGLAGTARPFSIQLRPASGPPAEAPSKGSPPRSTITYGSALTSEFVSALSAGHLILLLSSEEARRVPRVRVEIPDDIRATVWGLHWWAPEPPENPEWHRWLEDETPRLREALDTMPRGLSEGLGGTWAGLVDRREFRERLAQTTIARARLRGATEVEPVDLHGAVHSLIGAIQRVRAWAHEGRGPLTRLVDRTEGGRTTRLRRALEALAETRPDGISLEEAVTAVGQGATTSSVENQLERLRIRGVLFQDRFGRYHIA